MRRLQIKFPNQIRISGWDFGSSARAMNQAGGKDSLMTYECEFPQAELGKGLNSTTERKSMSTKTTIKRIALVAVSALGLGVLTSVAPASAATVTATGVSAGAVGPARVGVATTVRIAITHAAAAATTDTMVVTATLTAKPTLSTGTVLDLNAGGASSATLTRLGNTYANATFASNPSASATVSSGTAAVASTTATTNYVDVALTPDVAGTYTYLVSVGNSTYVAGDKSVAVTITTAGAPATATMTTIASAIAANGANGSPIKVVLKDANGNVTKPDANEAITLSVTTGSATLSGASSVSLGASDFVTGAAITNIKDATASDTVVVTLAGGGLLGGVTSLNTTLAMTSTANASLNTAAGTAAWQQGTGVATTGFKLASQTSLIYPATATSQSIGLSSLTANGASTDTSATTKYATIVVTDTTGAITGFEGTVFDRVVSQAGYGATISSALSITATLGTTHSYTVSNALNSNTLVVTGATPAATTVGAISPAIVNSAIGGSNTFTAKVTDQFGVAYANAAVTASVSAGRNSATASAALASDASGYVSWTLKDTGTTGTSDTVQFAGATTVTATVNYGLATVSTATITGGDTTAGVTATVKSVKDISAGDGAEAGAQTFTVTVKDVNGALLSGLPVSWSVSGTGAAVTSTTKAGWTSSTGTNSASVYAWIAGTYTVTASVGGKTATAEITFGQTGAGEERSISATVSGPMVTAKVVDRFGNPVPGVTVYATKTGDGYFGAGVTKTSGTTATDGTVEFVVAGGAADVTVSTLSYSAVAGTCPSGQTGALKGNLDCTADPADATAFTATTAGTAVKAEAGVGASYDAAGVSSASVSVTSAGTSDSVDAANEATDAANAATDAANAAAEAADAATAAAQDAQAAVAELATKVASLIAGIKAQITTLTNLVIKIQKKVRA